MNIQVVTQKNEFVKSKIWIYGASGHGKVLLEALQASGFSIGGFLDDDESKKDFMGYRVWQGTHVVELGDIVVFGIGHNHTRKILSERFNFDSMLVVHPSAVVSPSATIGVGTVVFHNSIIQAFAEIGKHCIINTAASIDHDCVVGDYVHISPNATLCGGVTVGEGSQIGAAAVVIQNVKIGKWVVVGAGSVVIRDVPDYAVIVGNPARIIKYNTPH